MVISGSSHSLHAQQSCDLICLEEHESVNGVTRIGGWDTVAAKLEGTITAS